MVRFHEMREQHSLFKAHSVVLISVFESNSENMLKYVANETIYTTMIPDTSLSLCNLDGPEVSFWKNANGIFHRAIGKLSKEKKCLQKK